MQQLYSLKIAAECKNSQISAGQISLLGCLCRRFKAWPLRNDKLVRKGRRLTHMNDRSTSWWLGANVFISREATFLRGFEVLRSAYYFLCRVMRWLTTGFWSAKHTHVYKSSRAPLTNSRQKTLQGQDSFRAINGGTMFLVLLMWFIWNWYLRYQTFSQKALTLSELQLTDEWRVYCGEPRSQLHPSGSNSNNNVLSTPYSNQWDGNDWLSLHMNRKMRWRRMELKSVNLNSVF